MNGIDLSQGSVSFLRNSKIVVEKFENIEKISRKERTFKGQSGKLKEMHIKMTIVDNKVFLNFKLQTNFFSNVPCLFYKYSFIILKKDFFKLK